MYNVIFCAYHVLGLRSLLTGRHICIRHVVTLLAKPHHVSRGPIWPPPKLTALPTKLKFLYDIRLKSYQVNDPLG